MQLMTFAVTENAHSGKRGEIMNNEITVTYTVDVTEVLKNIDEEFIKNDYPDIIRDKLRNKMGFDDVKIGEFKIFVGAFTE